MASQRCSEDYAITMLLLPSIFTVLPNLRVSERGPLVPRVIADVVSPPMLQISPLNGDHKLEISDRVLALGPVHSLDHARRARDVCAKSDRRVPRQRWIVVISPPVLHLPAHQATDDLEVRPWRQVSRGTLCSLG